MNSFEQLTERLSSEPKLWLVTGVAGFIGSNLLETLLRLNQLVVGLDNYATGSRGNLDQVRDLVGADRWKHFLKIDGDIRDLHTCKRASHGVDCILHQAALGSVPRSLANPGDAHATNVTGFLNMLLGYKPSHTVEQGLAEALDWYRQHLAGPEPEVPSLKLPVRSRRRLLPVP
ncbi:MAG: GDP-mannose 4,6-dehydratase [Verrucomicrobiota bacterium]|jgi:UDP-N-acetylglucosamine 4-epimerase